MPYHVGSVGGYNARKYLTPESCELKKLSKTHVNLDDRRTAGYKTPVTLEVKEKSERKVILRKIYMFLNKRLKV